MAATNNTDELRLIYKLTEILSGTKKFLNFNNLGHELRPDEIDFLKERFTGKYQHQNNNVNLLKLF
uniref:Uncharacterized protein n=1 Tax=Meloidogyne enterolobii TaxID=390850 RepID=A0A6V7VI08_MELEN|nr:unnamed protein product [Meloidogyne enterolobii]